ncbi:hypothetical protein [Streptomyces sp. Go-475]|uniref:hypothetical protein n=1 Tax=Streptomyces sp. Go-475 TaxID=2072505 RepID=UPI0031BB7A37
MPASIAATKRAAAAIVAAARRLPRPSRGAERRPRPAWGVRVVCSAGAPGSA